MPVLCRLIEITAAFQLRIIDFLIDCIVLYQILMCVKCINLTIVQHKDSVSRLNTGDTLGNNDLRRARDFFRKRSPDACIRRRIYRACRIIQDQDFRFLQKGTGNTQTLFLSS